VVAKSKFWVRNQNSAVQKKEIWVKNRNLTNKNCFQILYSNLVFQFESNVDFVIQNQRNWIFWKKMQPPIKNLKQKL